MKAKSARTSSMESPSRLLQKWQRNQIVEAIQAAGLDPREFDLDDSGVQVRIKHRWSESCFIVGDGPGLYGGRYVAGDAPAWPYEAYSWQSLISRVSRWLEEVKRDLEMPDLWAEFQREVQLLGAGSDGFTDNTPFTPDEQREIAGRLQELVEHAKHAYSLSDAQTRILEAKIDYLVNAASRLGRIDWRNVFAGVILGFILTAALPPESARDILLTLLRAIGHLYPELPSGYLARYTHRVAIGNSRLVSLADEHVSFRWKDYRENGDHKNKVMKLTVGEFMRRFLLHVLPDGFHRIRHYGLFANGHRADKIATCRKLLNVPAVKSDSTGHDQQAEPTAIFEPPACPCCGGRMKTIETFDGPLSRSYHVRRFDSS